VDDEPRLLARDSSKGYVDHSSRALNREPEAVPEDVQHRISRESRTHWELLRAEEIAQLQTRSRLGKLQQLETEARRKRVDVTRHVAAIDKELSAMQALVWPA
jgi:hypothetical protein